VIRSFASGLHLVGGQVVCDNDIAAASVGTKACLEALAVDRAIEHAPPWLSRVIRYVRFSSRLGRNTMRSPGAARKLERPTRCHRCPPASRSGRRRWLPRRMRSRRTGRRPCRHGLAEAAGTMAERPRPWSSRSAPPTATPDSAAARPARRRRTASAVAGLALPDSEKCWRVSPARWGSRSNRPASTPSHPSLPCRTLYSISPRRRPMSLSM
jgi:hypothetical protein